ncbi:MAG TPA: response regulator [Myxococcales bacterium]|nr:response regulator [Myxococcales bacterium]
MTTRKAAGTVLVVEDDGDIRDELADVIEDSNYRTIRAANGAVALQKLRGGPRPCVILLDLMMPVMDGHAFLAEQQSDAALKEIPVVVLSAHVDGARGGTQMSAAAFLKKPIDLAELLSTIAKFCGKS